MSKAIKIECEDSVDISGVSELHKQITSQLKNGCTIALDASQVERVDMAGLQLFAALFNDAPAKNITVSWLNPSEALHAAAKTAGLDKLLQLA